MMMFQDFNEENNSAAIMLVSDNLLTIYKYVNQFIQKIYEKTLVNERDGITF